MFKRNTSFGGARGGKKFRSRDADNRSYGGRDTRGGGFADRDSARPQLHKATCAGCGEQCTVPFKPNGSKPIYCNNCFRKDGEPKSDMPRRRVISSRNSAGGGICGTHGEEIGNKNGGLVEKRLDEAHMKLDRILREIETIKEMSG